MASPELSAALLRTHAPAMREALEEAAHALEVGDVPVGAVILGTDGRVIGRGHNRREVDQDPTAHAEVLALRDAAANRRTWRLDGVTVVVTLEPCAMCAGALALARVQTVVYGATDPKAGAVGSLWDLLRDRRSNHRPEVISGVLADECSAVLNSFFTGRREH
ncbi:tRNA adenosine(34) deaminase TadA [Phytoactinopolyspora endophytica]|uniref:tRNA adenosine(34) deaminase TadA n=1 Tax=Phytoactinopolyspora endophytica TaxID=1642495 RepID=UPI001F0E3F6F|nr:tRNA adenosine(34) deaminase TadA [Phytoactinopolyspora endophytica]